MVLLTAMVDSFSFFYKGVGFTMVLFTAVIDSFSFFIQGLVLHCFNEQHSHIGFITGVAYSSSVGLWFL